MILYRVCYLSADNTHEEHTDTHDLQEALDLYAQHGPQRATIWQTEATITDTCKPNPPWIPLEPTP